MPLRTVNCPSDGVRLCAIFALNSRTEYFVLMFGLSCLHENESQDFGPKPRARD
jgi:hypothetical protein